MWNRTGWVEVTKELERRLAGPHGSELAVPQAGKGWNVRNESDELLVCSSGCLLEGPFRASNPATSLSERTGFIGGRGRAE
jgi:hypothetical protein